MAVALISSRSVNARRPPRTGIYFLFGTDEEDQRLAYIGQSDNVADRLVQHDAKKEFWDEVVIITSKDSNLTSAHVRYLEARLVAIAQTVGRSRLENGNVPRGGADLPEADASDMDYFIDQIRILLPVLGHEIVRRRVTPRPAIDSSGHAATNAEVVDTSRRRPKVSCPAWLQRPKILRYSICGRDSALQRRRR